MDDLKKKANSEIRDKEIIYSRAVKAGKRIYYLDVKKNRKEEMFLAITESKKVFTGEGDQAKVSFEKHKIFLYKEDFEKFMSGLKQAIDYITEQEEDDTLSFSNLSEENGVNDLLNEEVQESDTSCIGGKISIDIDFE